MPKKYCPRCGLDKEITEFSPNRCSSGGLFGYCRECKHAYEKEYRTAHPRDPKKRKIQADEYRKSNREALNQRNRDYYNKNTIKVLARIKKYRKENPEAILELNRHYQQQRRARVRDLPGNGWSIEEERQLIQEYGCRCAYCGKRTKKLDMDHIIPIARGGIHSIENIVPACGFCNGSKNDKPLLFWLYQQRVKTLRLMEVNNG